MIDRIRDLNGAALAEQLLEIPATTIGGISLRGFIGKPGVSRSTRAQQIVFINGRAVENTTVHYALREGYHTALMKGQYPVTYLFIEMDPAAVDVNVHPAKREVRFRDPSSVKEAIVETIRKTIEKSGREDRGRRHSAPAPPPFVFQRALYHRRPFAETLPLIEPREQVTLSRGDWSSLPLQNSTIGGTPEIHSSPTFPEPDHTGSKDARSSRAARKSSAAESARKEFSAFWACWENYTCSWKTKPAWCWWTSMRRMRGSCLRNCAAGWKTKVCRASGC